MAANQPAETDLAREAPFARAVERVCAVDFHQSLPETRALTMAGVDFSAWHHVYARAREQRSRGKAFLAVADRQWELHWSVTPRKEGIFAYVPQKKHLGICEDFEYDVSEGDSHFCVTFGWARKTLGSKGMRSCTDLAKLLTLMEVKLQSDLARARSASSREAGAGGDARGLADRKALQDLVDTGGYGPPDGWQAILRAQATANKRIASRKRIENEPKTNSTGQTREHSSEHASANDARERASKGGNRAESELAPADPKRQKRPKRRAEADAAFGRAAPSPDAATGASDSSRTRQSIRTAGGPDAAGRAGPGFSDAGLDVGAEALKTVFFSFAEKSAERMRVKKV
ncbi:hypothetical protein KFL_005540020 [Klebsormidium nitens]|uniref:Uncharacterized protein n=1 Tax=Klebsormidium nitens TaxID=105231 RepID=A0A1Y1INM6_KLENI|nr:hypothetical protein KFL_005540020 [Klebsormidium nitens]|eukprot:GAQ89708.1 hypothetical protein KFL_005540020 [Klebsormidium nitens]